MKKKLSKYLEINNRTRMVITFVSWASFGLGMYLSLQIQQPELIFLAFLPVIITTWVYELKGGVFSAFCILFIFFHYYFNEYITSFLLVYFIFLITVSISMGIFFRNNSKTILYNDTVVSTHADFLWKTDTSFNFQNVSLSVKKILGYGPDEMLGKNYLDFVYSADLYKLKPLLEALEKDQEPLSDVENIFLHKNGELIVLETNSVPLFSPNNTFLGYQGISRDITKRKSFQAEIQRRDAILKTITLLAGDLLRIPEWQQNIHEILRNIGQVTGASRVCLIEFHEKTETNSLLKTYQEWYSPGANNYPEEVLRNMIPNGNELFDYWENKFFQTTIVSGNINDNPPEEQKYFLSPETLSFVVVTPIVVQDRLWGIFFIEDQSGEISWVTVEIEAVKAIADIIGDAINRGYMELEQKQSEQRYRAVVEDQTELICRYDREGNLSFVNEAFCRYFGNDQPDLVGEKIQELLPCKDHGLLETLADRNEIRETVFHSEHEYINGEHKAWLRWNDRLILQDGEVIEFQSVGKDVTERKQAEDELRHSEAQNRAILEAIPDLIFHIHCPAESLASMEKNEENLIAMVTTPNKNSLKEMLTSEAVNKFWSHIENLTDNINGSMFEYKMPTPEKIISYEIRMVPMGEYEILAILRDISEEAALEQMKSDFINRASHELRTPITTAKMAIEMLREGGDPEEMETFWSILQKEIDRQQTLVEELLTLGRVEAGTMRINLEEVSLNRVFEKVLEAVNPLAIAKNIEIKISLPDNLSNVFADRTGLERAFTNLLSNAIKYSGTDSHVNVNASEKDFGVEVEIVDRGIGIPKSDIPYLFNRFYRASNANKMEIPGSGIGLFIVKSIIEALSGKIEFETEENKGSIFRVWLPSVN
ncbi:MAG: PAS domain S-box protein [Anaerolineales bacterium]|nr:PAS domain S-box protein [Anaerolineales bacterium]